jgi:predicted HicB family RNase H-like nuclease
MQLVQALTRLDTALEAQLRLADEETSALGADLIEVMRPALRQTLLEVTEMAAQEIGGQLQGQRVETRMVEGEPELRVTADESNIPSPPSAAGDPDTVDAEARITLRLPGYLKDLIAEAADESGDSVNTFVVDALRTKAHVKQPNTRVRTTIDL